MLFIRSFLLLVSTCCIIYCLPLRTYITLIYCMASLLCLQDLYGKLNRMASIAADMFVGRERFATMLLMRLTETVILWLSEDQTFWDDIEEGPRPLGDLGLQQVWKTDCRLCDSSYFPYLCLHIYILNSCSYIWI